MPSDHVVVVLTTFPVDGDVDRFARTLVEERLAACVNVLPVMRSTYAWKGIETSEERQIVIKTTSDRVTVLEERLKALHPYDIPEFLVLPVVEGSRDYLAWVAGSTGRST